MPITLVLISLYVLMLAKKDLLDLTSLNKFIIYKTNQKTHE